MTHDNVHWKFASPIASLRNSGLTGRVDVSRPQMGVDGVSVNSLAILGTLFAAEWIAEDIAGNSAKSATSAGWPMNAAEAYVRGGDLVATYGRLPNSHYAPQIYWRLEQVAAESGTALSGLSLIVSVQTDLLDSHPRIGVSTRLAADELIRVDVPGSACLLWRLQGGVNSYAEIVAASDYREPPAVGQSAGLHCARWELFAEFLEKGVIRRAQIHGVFLPRERDTELAKACCHAIELRPLPLTT